MRVRRPPKATSSMPGHRLIHRFVPDAAALARELVDGLLSPRATIAPKFLYDDLGCALYGAICLLPEYYLTRTEAAIFAREQQAIAHAARATRQLIDLGAGDCAKARFWIPRLRPARYVAVDLAASALDRALRELALDFPEPEIVGVITDFTAGLDLDGALDQTPALFFYPGSSIGNFAPEDAIAFLAAIRAECAKRRGSGLLIGVDLVKDAQRLSGAYDDALGVTAAFNRNVLHHVNAMIGSDFRPSAFAHRGVWNAGEMRIEMHLEAIAEERVSIDGHARHFGAGERIHTESSYKYTLDGFDRLLARAGFGTRRAWTDGASDFAVYYAE